MRAFKFTNTITTALSLVFAIFLIATALYYPSAGKHFGLSVREAHAEACGWILTQDADEAGLTCQRESSGLCYVCIENGDGDSGSGPTSCPGDQTVPIDCPADTYSGTHTVTYSYNRIEGCADTNIIANPDGSTSCSNPTFTCEEYVSNEENTCVPRYYCSPPDGSPSYPAPNNDVNQCPNNGNSCPSVPGYVSCLGGESDQSPFGDPNAAYWYEGSPDGPYSFLETKNYSNYLIGGKYYCINDRPSDVDLSHADYCVANPSDPSCCNAIPPIVISPANISVDDAPGVPWNFDPTHSGSANATFTTAPGNYTLTVTPTGSCASPSVTNTIDGITSPGGNVVLVGGENVIFTITCPQPFSYSLSTVSAPLSTQQGNPTQAVISANLLTGTSQTVNLNVSWPSGQPTGVGYSFSPSSGCLPTCNTTINFTIAGNAQVGTFPVTVSGSPAASNGSVGFSLTIISGPPSANGPSTASPSPAKTGQQVTWTACSASGGTQPYTYRWIGDDLPAGGVTTAVNTLLHTYTTTGTKTMDVTITDSNGLTASCLQGKLKVLLDAQFKEF
ncbi:hypothetical protein KW785_00835 [Candidatus Parcubacteria bacterium]|nr:hypothetical protein [Candidatus Parcubacteria bacterium]